MYYRWNEIIYRSIFKILFSKMSAKDFYSFCIMPSRQERIISTYLEFVTKQDLVNETKLSVNFDSGDVLLYHSAKNDISIPGQSDIFQTVQPTANSLRKKGSFLSLCCLSVFIFIPLSSYCFTFARKIVKRKSQHLLRVSRREKKSNPFPL